MTIVEKLKELVTEPEISTQMLLFHEPANLTDSELKDCLKQIGRWTAREDNTKRKCELLLEAAKRFGKWY